MCIDVDTFFFVFKDDHSRVVLDRSTHELDYINANYIEVSIVLSFTQ